MVWSAIRLLMVLLMPITSSIRLLTGGGVDELVFQNGPRQPFPRSPAERFYGCQHTV